jgi:decaprenylphospho-beta-D-erythro-pentofuranosid-2-ulose 2-reductase
MNDYKNVLVVGANSDIAKECSLIWAKRGCNFVLASRDLNKMNELKQKLEINNAPAVYLYEIDVINYETHGKLIEFCEKNLGKIDLVLIAHGVLFNSEEMKNTSNLKKLIEINGVSTVLLIRALFNHMKNNVSGGICVISSIAGDRSRPSNFEYGMTKQMVSFYLEGLRQEAHECNISLTLIKPGLVATSMTSHMPKTKLFSSPVAVGYSIVRAVDRHKFLVYTPRYWKIIAVILRRLPFKFLARSNI